MEEMTFESPVGPVTYREIDHQSTMGAYVGYTAQKEGRGIMIKWQYRDGKDYLPGDEEVKQLRKE